MTGTLRKQADEWRLENSDGNVIQQGTYPLVEDTAFIENAAAELNNWQYHDKPYDVVDERGE
jgi:hypothetical protein